MHAILDVLFDNRQENGMGLRELQIINKVPGEDEVVSRNLDYLFKENFIEKSGSKYSISPKGIEAKKSEIDFLNPRPRLKTVVMKIDNSIDNSTHVGHITNSMVNINSTINADLEEAFKQIFAELDKERISDTEKKEKLKKIIELQGNAKLKNTVEWLKECGPSVAAIIIKVLEKTIK
jgi:hypothetical protein